jgi:hypothetical protein
MGNPNNDPSFYKCDRKCSGTMSPNGRKDLQGRVLYECDKCGRKTSDQLLMDASRRRRLLD